MTQRPRVVLDTNVVLTALVFGGGLSSGIRLAWQDGLCTPLVSAATTHELMRVLAYPKFRLDAVQQDELLADYLPWTRVVRVPQPPPRVPDCRDPADTKFLHLAISGRASALVTGDKDLLALAGTMPCAVLTPADWLSAVQH